MTPKCRKGGTEVDIGGSDTSPPDTLVSSLTHHTGIGRPINHYTRNV